MEGPGQGRVRVCAIGDSMYNDIEGAHREGFASILIASGIHAEALGVTPGGGDAVDKDRLELFLSANFAFRPTHVVPQFGLATGKM